MPTIAKQRERVVRLAETLAGVSMLEDDSRLKTIFFLIASIIDESKEDDISIPISLSPTALSNGDEID